MANYRKLFDINLHHTYYLGNKCRDITINHPPETLVLLQNMGIVFRAQLGCITYYYDEDKKDILASFFNDTSEEYIINITLQSTNTHFLNYTELEGLNTNSILFFSNENNETSTDLGWSLSKHEKVSIDDYLNIKENLNNNILLTQDTLNRSIGIVNIKLNGLKSPFLDLRNEIVPKKYYIFFSSRSTYWNYYLVQKNSNFDHDVKIKDLNGEINFSSSTQVKLMDDTSAKLIKSEIPLLLKEHTSYHFQLVSNSKNAERVIIKKLAVASFDYIQYNEANENKKFKSNIFIYY